MNNRKWLLLLYIVAAVLTLFLPNTAQGAGVLCPAGWHHGRLEDREVCLCIIHTPLPWRRARAKCGEDSAFLLKPSPNVSSIADRDLWVALSYELENVWTGLHQENNELVWDGEIPTSYRGKSFQPLPSLGRSSVSSSLCGMALLSRSSTDMSASGDAVKFAAIQPDFRLTGCDRPLPSVCVKDVWDARNTVGSVSSVTLLPPSFHHSNIFPEFCPPVYVLVGDVRMELNRTRAGGTAYSAMSCGAKPLVKAECRDEIARNSSWGKIEIMENCPESMGAVARMEFTSSSSGIPSPLTAVSEKGFVTEPQKISETVDDGISASVLYTSIFPSQRVIHKKTRKPLKRNRVKRSNSNDDDGDDDDDNDDDDDGDKKIKELHSEVTDTPHAQDDGELKSNNFPQDSEYANAYISSTFPPMDDASDDDSNRDASSSQKAAAILSRINITNTRFDDKLPQKRIKDETPSSQTLGVPTQEIESENGFDAVMELPESLERTTAGFSRFSFSARADGRGLSFLTTASFWKPAMMPTPYQPAVVVSTEKNVASASLSTGSSLYKTTRNTAAFVRSAGPQKLKEPSENDYHSSNKNDGNFRNKQLTSTEKNEQSTQLSNTEHGLVKAEHTTRLPQRYLPLPLESKKDSKRLRSAYSDGYSSHEPYSLLTEVQRTLIQKSPISGFQDSSSEISQITSKKSESEETVNAENPKNISLKIEKSTNTKFDEFPNAARNDKNKKKVNNNVGGKSNTDAEAIVNDSEKETTQANSKEKINSEIDYKMNTNISSKETAHKLEYYTENGEIIKSSSKISPNTYERKSNNDTVKNIKISADSDKKFNSETPHLPNTTTIEKTNTNSEDKSTINTNETISIKTGLKSNTETEGTTNLETENRFNGETYNKTNIEAKDKSNSETDGTTITEKKHKFNIKTITNIENEDKSNLEAHDTVSTETEGKSDIKNDHTANSKIACKPVSKSDETTNTKNEEKSNPETDDKANNGDNKTMNTKTEYKSNIEIDEKNNYKNDDTSNPETDVTTNTETEGIINTEGEDSINSRSKEGLVTFSEGKSNTEIDYTTTKKSFSTGFENRSNTNSESRAESETEKSINPESEGDLESKTDDTTKIETHANDKSGSEDVFNTDSEKESNLQSNKKASNVSAHSESINGTKRDMKSLSANNSNIKPKEKIRTDSQYNSNTETGESTNTESVGKFPNTLDIWNEEIFSVETKSDNTETNERIGTGSINKSYTESEKKFTTETDDETNLISEEISSIDSEDKSNAEPKAIAITGSNGSFFSNYKDTQNDDVNNTESVNTGSEENPNLKIEDKAGINFPNDFDDIDTDVANITETKKHFVIKSKANSSTDNDDTSIRKSIGSKSDFEDKLNTAMRQSGGADVSKTTLSNLLNSGNSPLRKSHDHTKGTTPLTTSSTTTVTDATNKRIDEEINNFELKVPTKTETNNSVIKVGHVSKENSTETSFLSGMNSRNSSALEYKRNPYIEHQGRFSTVRPTSDSPPITSHTLSPWDRAGVGNGSSKDIITAGDQITKEKPNRPQSSSKVEPDKRKLASAPKDYDTTLTPAHTNQTAAELLKPLETEERNQSVPRIQGNGFREENYVDHLRFGGVVARVNRNKTHPSETAVAGFLRAVDDPSPTVPGFVVVNGSGSVDNSLYSKLQAALREKITESSRQQEVQQSKTGDPDDLRTNETAKTGGRYNQFIRVDDKVEPSSVDILEQAAIRSEDYTSLEIHDIVRIAGILENSTSESNLREWVGYNVVKIINNMMEVDEEKLKAAEKIAKVPNRMIKSLEMYGNNAYLGTKNPLILSWPNCAVEIWDLDKGDNLVLGFGSLTSNTMKNKSLAKPLITIFNGSEMAVADMDAGIMLPHSLFTHPITGVLQKSRLVFSVYRKVSFFKMAMGYDNRTLRMHSRQLNSHVVSASLNGQELRQLTENITAVFKPLYPGRRTTCVYWNFSLTDNHGGWSTKGCYLNGTIQGREVCLCDHLTNFAILMDFYGDLGNNFKDHGLSLTVISIIGLSLSIFGLIFTIITFIAFKKFRQGRAQQTLFNMSLSLLLAWIVFLVGIEQTQNYIGCLLVAVLLHYLILVSFMWMLVEAVLQYLAFVKVLGTYITRFILKAVILSWGTPLIPITVVLSVNYKMYRGHPHYCWMHLSAFYYAFAIPVGFIVLLNMAVFILIVWSITRQKKELRSTQSSKKKALTNLQAAFSCFVLLGLTWLFGFLTLEEARTTFQYVFTVLNSMQGFLIFTVFVLRKKHVRDQWLGLCLKKPQTPVRVNYPSSSKNEASSTLTSVVSCATSACQDALCQQSR